MTVLFAAGGCGFASALAHPEAQTQAAQPVASGVPSSTPDPKQPRVIADGDLLTSAGAPAGHVAVSVGSVRSGLVPPVSDTSACRFDGPSLQFVPVEFATSPGLAAHVEIGTGPATPADI